MAKVWKNTPDNFWAQTAFRENGCREWIGKREKSGYGRVSWLGKKRLSHRVSMYLAGKLGDLDSDLFVLHHCDNPPCCNPDHLFLGSKKDNTQDAVRKGRQLLPNNRGERSGNAKITNAQASEIRSAYAKGGVSQQRLADTYGVNQMSISKIVRGLSYNG